MNRSELETVYQTHRQGLFTLALSITRCRGHAEDAIHDAFSKLARRDSVGGDQVAYIYASVRNAARDVLRRNSRQLRMTESIFNGYAPAAPPNCSAPDDSALSRERDQQIRRAIDSLPGKYREAVVLKIYGGLTFRQMGQVLDEPWKTVATRYRRALERLTDCLKGEL